MTDRTSRESTTRTAAPARRKFTPPSSLPDPRPMPGYGFRWIMTHVMGQSEPSNVSKRFHEGWEPVRAEDHPEMSFATNKSGNIEIGGLMLCKAPNEAIESREEYYQNQAVAQAESVNNHYMRQNDARMPLFADTKSTVTRGLRQ